MTSKLSNLLIYNLNIGSFELIKSQTLNESNALKTMHDDFVSDADAFNQNAV